MPYAIVETTDLMGFKELLAVPESWLDYRSLNAGYLSWPNVRNGTTLNTLLLNENSIPTMMWEKHRCAVKQMNLDTLASAREIIKAIQRQAVVNASVKNPTTISVPNTASKFRQRKNSNGQSFMTVDEFLEDTGMDELDMPFVGNVLAADPLSDKPVAQSMDILNDIKTLIQKNQEETKKLLVEGFVSFRQNLLSAVDDKLKDAVAAIYGVVSGDKLTPGEKPKILNDIILRKPDKNTPSPSILETIDLDNILTPEPAASNPPPSDPDDHFDDDTPLSVPPMGCKSSSDESDGVEPLFFMYPINSMPKMDRFEQQLNDEAFRTKVHKWVSNTLSALEEPEHRMMRMLDLIIDRKFFPNFTWVFAKGRSRKVPLTNYRNILRLFEFIGTTPKHHANFVSVGNFFVKKIRYSSARVNLRETNKSVPHTRRQKLVDKNAGMVINPYEPQAFVIDQKTGRPMDIEMFCVNPLSTIEEIEDFEERLSDEEYHKQVCRWIDCTVGHESDHNKRMMEIINGLFDKSFLANFTWANNETGKHAMENFKNIITIFEYVGSTATHSADYNYVEEFFIKAL